MSNIARGISLNNLNNNTTEFINNTNLSSDINNENVSKTSNFSNVLSQQMLNSYRNSIRNVPLGRPSSSYNINSNNNNETIDNSVPDNNYVNIEQDNSVSCEFRVDIKAKDSETKDKIANAVRDASKRYSVDANLILAVIQTESNFNPNVKSSAGAVGLMQIMPSNFKYLGVNNGYDIEDNINAGTKLLKEYIDKYNGDIEMALMAYNGGPTRMANRGVNSINDIYKMPKETQNYVPKVMRIYRGY